MELFAEYGYFGLFVAAFLAATLLPLGSELLLILMINQGFDLFNVVFFASVGNTLGAVFNYWVGLKSNHFIMERLLKISQQMQEKAIRLFDQYGIYLLLFAWLPIVGDPLTLVAGLLRYNFVGFFVLVSIGKTMRYYLLAIGVSLF